MLLVATLALAVVLPCTADSHIAWPPIDYSKFIFGSLAPCRICTWLPDGDRAVAEQVGSVSRSLTKYPQMKQPWYIVPPGYEDVKWHCNLARKLVEMQRQADYPLCYWEGIFVPDELRNGPPGGSRRVSNAPACAGGEDLVYSIGTSSRTYQAGAGECAQMCVATAGKRWMSDIKDGNCASCGCNSFKEQASQNTPGGTLNITIFECRNASSSSCDAAGGPSGVPSGEPSGSSADMSGLYMVFNTFFEAFSGLEALVKNTNSPVHSAGVTLGNEIADQLNEMPEFLKQAITEEMGIESLPPFWFSQNLKYTYSPMQLMIIRAADAPEFVNVWADIHSRGFQATKEYLKKLADGGPAPGNAFSFLGKVIPCSDVAKYEGKFSNSADGTFDGYFDDFSAAESLYASEDLLDPLEEQGSDDVGFASQHHIHCLVLVALTYASYGSLL
eukprot:gnl/TRDRNA2_/TRDRNA2_34689_c0_seq1.p1 gnl/TRDRNA2_/TRDRNA2_34689_c0~~gnl/TRDRNA2_/TRDRNA2_34689_c0_seq1.p1  ORF type:complete len:444 (-),score=58.56 gnl/TRDRNA2_/TRDRNA2_34689_c0_seq1:67-1398(-)